MTVSAATGNSRRTESKQRRRLELIRATIKCIAAAGLSGVTMATVTREAGLSLGIVNLHFESKEKLLIETLRYVADEYCQAWQRIRDDDKLDAAEKLKGMVDVDFSRPICERNKLAVWFAFWGETRSRPTYRRICAAADRDYDDALLDICRELGGRSGVQAALAERAAATYSALSNGLWLDLLICPQDMRREQARDICMDYLTGVFGAAMDTE